MGLSLVLTPETQTAPPDDRALWARPIRFVPLLPYDTLSEAPLEQALDPTFLLESTRETHLFEQMNLAYYRAATIRQELSQAPTEGGLAELRYWLTRGDSIRNRLVVIFHRLSVSIAKRFVSPRHSLDELVSEGDATLLRAITLFDPSRGFRFSTYATHALRRRLGRYVNSPQHLYAVPVDFQETPQVADTRRWTPSYERAITAESQWLEGALYMLSHRERYILRCRFGWGREFEPRTLQDIAEELGVSRERIRQLESRALAKLRKLAAKVDLPT